VPGQGRLHLRPRLQQQLLRRGHDDRTTLALHGATGRADRVHLAGGARRTAPRVHLRPRVQRVHHLSLQGKRCGPSRRSPRCIAFTSSRTAAAPMSSFPRCAS
jgi:hypothetical protein